MGRRPVGFAFRPYLAVVVVVAPSGQCFRPFALMTKMESNNDQTRTRRLQWSFSFFLFSFLFYWATGFDCGRLAAAINKAIS